jgi:hypothetical protein
MHGQKSAWRGDNPHSSLWQENTDKYPKIQEVRSGPPITLHYSEIRKRHHNNIHKFYCCRVSKQGFLMHTKLRLIHVWRVYIHTSLLYFLTTTGTLVGGICQSQIVRSFVFVNFTKPWLKFEKYKRMAFKIIKCMNRIMELLDSLHNCCTRQCCSNCKGSILFSYIYPFHFINQNFYLNTWMLLVPRDREYFWYLHLAANR